MWYLLLIYAALSFCGNWIDITTPWSSSCYPKERLLPVQLKKELWVPPLRYQISVFHFAFKQHLSSVLFSRSLKV